MAVSVQTVLGDVRPVACEVDVFRHVAEQAAEETLYDMLCDGKKECDVTIAGTVYHITVQSQAKEETRAPDH